MKLISKPILFLSLIVFYHCGRNSYDLITPSDYLIGQELDFVATGLIPGETYTLLAEKTDQHGRYWTSNAIFKANKNGSIVLNNQAPVSGTYNKDDTQGLFWSMTMPSAPDKDWQAPKPLDYCTVEFSLIRDSDTLFRKSTKQWVIPQNVSKEDIKENGIVARLYRPKSDTNTMLPGIIFLGGSGGGLSWASRMAAITANEGYNCLAVAYFNTEGLPRHLAQLPLEYVDNVIDYFINRNDTDDNKIGVIGYSKGAELALLMASRRTEIKSVVAIAPGSAVFQGFKPPEYPTVSSWTLDGEDLPFVPNAYDKRFFETYDGMYLWYKTLAQHEAFNKAALRVDKINGDILLLSGVKDQIWPSTFMAEQLIARLHIASFPHQYNHLAFPDAGHAIAEPPGHPLSGPTRTGGSPYGNAAARAQVWQSIKEFLEKNLKANEEQ